MVTLSDTADLGLHCLPLFHKKEARVKTLHARYFFVILLSSVDFFQDQLFKKKSFRNTIRVSNGFDPDQDRHSVRPDLGPNCLQKISADDKSSLQQGKALESFWYNKAVNQTHNHPG